jgi:hypothetical protein
MGIGTPGSPYGDNHNEAHRVPSYFPEAEIPHAGPSRTPGTQPSFPGGFVSAPSFPVPEILQVSPVGRPNRGHLSTYDTASLFFDTPNTSPKLDGSHAMPKPASTPALPLHIPRPARHSSLDPSPATPSPPSAGSGLHRAKTSPAPTIPPKPRPPIPAKVSYPQLRPSPEAHPEPPPLPRPPTSSASISHDISHSPPPPLPKPRISYPELERREPPIPPKPHFSSGDSGRSHSNPLPKPPGSPASEAALPNVSLPEPLVATPTSQEDEDEEFKRVLALSMAEQTRPVDEDEDAELAAAMRESLRIHHEYGGFPVFPAPVTSHEVDDAPTPTVSGSHSDWSHHGSLSTPATSVSSHEDHSNSTSRPASAYHVPLRTLSQIEEDEAFARRLAEEEEQALAAELEAMKVKAAETASIASSSEAPPPWSPPSSEAGPSTLTSASSSSLALPSPQDLASSPSPSRRHSDSPSVRPLPQPNRMSSVSMPPLPSLSPRPPSVDSASLQPSLLSVGLRPDSVVSMPELTGIQDDDEEEELAHPEPLPARAGKFIIDPEFTRGICEWLE